MALRQLQSQLRSSRSEIMVEVNVSVKKTKDNTSNILVALGKLSNDIRIDFADYLYDKSQMNLESFGKIDTGMLSNSGKVDHRDEFSVVSFSAPHASSVEFGREPGSMPPVEAIQKWTERKGITDKRPKGERDVLSSTAWAIAKHIERFGIKPTPFLRSALTDAKEQLPKIIMNNRRK